MKTRSNTLSMALATAFLGSACNGAVELGRNDGPVLGDDSGSGGSAGEGAGGIESSGGTSGVDAGEGAGGAVSSGGAPGAGGAGGLFSAPVDGGPCESGSETWATLIRHDWSLGPGEEAIYCVRKTLAEAVDYRALGSINPSGTHHVALSYGPPNGPDGTELCDETVSQPSPLYEVGGPGTLQVFPPDGMSGTIAAGEQILLRVHVYNMTDDVLAGTSVNEFTTDDSAPLCLPDVTRVNILVTEWELDPGQETEFCVRAMVSEELVNYRLLRVDNPLGTLESVLSVGPPTGLEGLGPCPSAPAPGRVLGGAGAGSWNYLPSGTSGNIQTGEQLLLRVHAVNVNDQALSEASAISFSD